MNNIYKERSKKTLNRSQLAKIIGTSATTIYSWEEEKSYPNSKMLVRLCHALDCSSDYLLGLTSKNIYEYRKEIKAQLQDVLKDIDTTSLELENIQTLMDVSQDLRNLETNRSLSYIKKKLLQISMCTKKALDSFEETPKKSELETNKHLIDNNAEILKAIDSDLLTEPKDKRKNRAKKQLS